MKPNDTQTPPIQDPQAELDMLAQQLYMVKLEMKDQRDRQLLIEERIAKLVGVKEEGTISQKTRDWKISTTGGLTRAIEMHDPEHYRKHLGEERFNDLLSVKLSIRTAEFRRASQEEKNILMEHAVIKPRKVTVKIERKEDS